MANQLEKIDETRLRPLVRRALQRDTAEILSWNRQQINGGIGGGLGGTAIYLFEGQAQDGDQQIPWSLILKVLEARKEEAPESSHYWKREAEAYRSGWLESLPGPLVAPRCLGVEEFADEGCWLWLEHVIDAIEDLWPFAHYGVVASHLGQFGGANALPTVSPTWPWLSSKFIRDDVEHAAANIDMMRRFSSHSFVHRVMPGNSRADLSLVFDQRETLLTRLEKLPQVLCHFDAFRSNLFARRNQDGFAETVAIDWAFIGLGPIGVEIVALVLVTLVAGQVEWSLARELDAVVFAGYLEGLRTAGWRGDPRQVRLAYSAALTLRWIGVFGYLPLADYLQQPTGEEAYDLRFLEFFDRIASIGPFAQDMANETLALMDAVG